MRPETDPAAVGEQSQAEKPIDFLPAWKRFKCALCERECNTPLYHEIKLVAGPKLVCSGCYLNLKPSNEP